MKPILIACGVLAALPALAQAPLPPDLRTMVEAERAFAAAAREKGIRDAFLEFFADDAMFEPGGGLAKERLRKQPSQPFSVRELVWEPRTGDVAASGELGWLTGPGTFIDHAGDRTPHHTNYLSVWRREPDGRWKVFIDIGTNLEAPATFEPGFVRFRFAPRYSGTESQERARKALADADAALNARIASAGAAAAYRETLAPGARVHRDRVGALTDPEGIEAWLARNAEGMSASMAAAESARSGDLGYACGKYRTAARTEGTYLRIWTRDASGRWRTVVDLFTPPR
jgi:ketosteroid isomerase-like protein